MDYDEIINKLESLKNPKNVEGMARFGIKPKAKVFGISMPEIRGFAKVIKKDHKLALELFDTGIHEAKILAGLIAESEKLTEKQIDKWIKSFDSWDVVDQTCMNLFDKSNIAKKKIKELSNRKKEFEKRTAFALMAALASHDKKMSDKNFIAFLPLIKKASTDERNFVKKAVNWALRGIGKRNIRLNSEAINCAKAIKNGPKGTPSRSAKWIANDAIRELTGKAVQQRLNK